MGRIRVDFLRNNQRQHPQTPEKGNSKVKLYELRDKPAYKDKPREYE